MNNLENIIGIDVGGTNIEAGLVNCETYKLIGDPISRPTFKKPLSKDRELSDAEKLQYAKEAVQNIGEIVNQYHSLLRKKSYKINVGVPGIIGPNGEILTGVVFGNFPLKKRIEEKLETFKINSKVHVENDANCGAYAHGEGQTLMIGTNLGSALNIDGELVERNTELKPSWSDYSIFDEAGFAIRIDKDTTRSFFEKFPKRKDKKEFAHYLDDYLDKLSKENKDSPGYIRLEQLLGGVAIEKMVLFLLGKKYIPIGADAKDLHEIIHDYPTPHTMQLKVNFTNSEFRAIRSVAEKIWEIEGTLLGYAIAQLKNKATQKRCSVKDFYIGGGVANALDHMQPFAEDFAHFQGAGNFKLKKSPYDNPNIIGAAIAFKKNYKNIKN